jgi:hypothetical protein
MKGYKIMVYVLNSEGKPLMPTQRHGKIRRLLRDGKAKVVRRCPFTIQLLYTTTNYTQPITLGVDAGSKTIGISAVTDTKELYAAEITIRNDIVKLLAKRREYRRARRNRKTRYRQPRFNNRVHRKKKGWLAPSIENKIASHLKVIEDLHNILPITRIIVETASFDIQKINNPDVQGNEYQEGNQLGFWNTREYVLWRDHHECQHCHGRSKDPILNVHHIESRLTGGNAPNNLITLCETCHHDYHSGKIKLNFKRGTSYRNAAFMGIMRWAFYNRLKEIYSSVSMTFGYITKNTRIRNNLEKTHCIDARCITGKPTVAPLGGYYEQKVVRNHNRRLHRDTILKGGVRKSNQAPKYTKGFQLFDKVRTDDKRVGFIVGRRSSGYFDIRKLDGEKISPAINYKRVKCLERRRHILSDYLKATPKTSAYAQ